MVTVPPGTTVFGSAVGSGVGSSAGVLVASGSEVGFCSGTGAPVAVGGTGVALPQALRKKTVAKIRRRMILFDFIISSTGPERVLGPYIILGAYFLTGWDN
jgi:hypothetical protein